MSDPIFALIVLMLEGVLIATVVFAGLFTIALNLGFVPAPSEGDWVRKLYFISSRRGQTLFITPSGTFGRYLLPAAETSSAWKAGGAWITGLARSLSRGPLLWIQMLSWAPGVRTTNVEIRPPFYVVEEEPWQGQLEETA